MAGNRGKEGIDKTMRTTVNKAIFCISLLAASLAVVGCASPLNDGANVQSKHYENRHTLRYVELFIVGGNGATQIG